MTVSLKDLRAAIAAIKRLAGRGKRPVEVTAADGKLTLRGGVDTTALTVVIPETMAPPCDDWAAILTLRRLDEMAAAARRAKADEVSVYLEHDCERNVEAFALRAQLASLDLKLYGDDAGGEPRRWNETPPAGQLTSTIAFDRDDLAAAIGQASLFASRNETRPILTGVLLELDLVNDSALAVATDTYRLFCERVKFGAREAPAGVEKLRIILPRRFCSYAAEALASGDGDRCQLVLRHRNPEGDATITCDAAELLLPSGAQLTTAAIEGQFVNYEKVIPSSQDHLIELDRDRLVETLQAGLAVAREDSNRVVMKDLGAYQFRLMAEARGAGSYSDIIGCQTYQGAQLEIAANARYLLDFFELLAPGSQVTLGAQGPLNSMSWTGPTGGGRRPLYVLMPMRIM